VQEIAFQAREQMNFLQVYLIGKGFQFKTFLATKFTTQHDLY